MLNKDSFIKFMHMAASVRQIRAVYKSLHSRAPILQFLRNPDCSWKKTFVYQKTQKCKKTYECKYNGD